MLATNNIRAGRAKPSESLMDLIDTPPGDLEDLISL